MPGSPIASIADVVLVADRLIVADQLQDRVVAFTTDGTVIGVIGRLGDGPGEFRRPHSVVLDADGTILIGDATQRITRVTRDLDLVNVYRVNVPFQVRRLANVRDDIAITLFNPRLEGDNFALWSKEEGLGRTFDVRSPLLREVPYWPMAFTTLVAATPQHVFAVDNMAYPIRVYSADLEFLDSVGAAPPSWIQARRPEPNEFSLAVGPGSEIRSFLRSFTRVDRLGVLDDRYLVVSHRYPVGEYTSDDEFRADIYDTADGIVKIWQDVLLSGRMIAADDCMWLVVQAPPEPWTLACYRLAGVQ
jgi:hypothetical protein